jgi:hypothetical protein
MLGELRRASRKESQWSGRRFYLVPEAAQFHAAAAVTKLSEKLTARVAADYDCVIAKFGEQTGGAEIRPRPFLLVAMATNEMKNSKYPPFADSAKSGAPEKSAASSEFNGWSTRRTLA